MFAIPKPSMTKFSPGRILTIGTVIICGTIAAVFFISYRQSQRVQNTSEWVNHTQEAIQHIQRLVMNALDNETGARGYVISGKDNFLEPLKRSVIHFDEEIRILDSLMKDNPEQLRSLDSMKNIIGRRIHFSDSMVATRKLEALRASIEMVESGVGKRYTDQIRELGLHMEQVEQALLQQRKSANESTIRELNTLLYTLLTAVLLLSIMMVRRIRRDILQREASERRFGALLQAAPDATIISDEQGKIRMVNHQAERLFGYNQKEMIDQPVEILIPASLHTAHGHHRNGFMKKASVRSMGAGLELFAVKKDGQEFPVEISLSPIRTDEGLMVIASVRDISARKALENTLRRTNAELEAFTYSVSHDLRAPLRGIVGFTAILEEEYGDKLDEEGRRIAGVIKSNTLKMGNLIDDLLAFSRLGRQEINKSQVDCTAMVKEIIAEMSKAHSEIIIHWNMGILPVVEADPTTLRQVWINLISNAIKYSSKSPSPEIEIGAKLDKGEQIFYIKDNGVGFDNKYRDKLFRVFSRLHSEEEFEGTGVGLALVDKIITRHGGRVWAEGKTGEGACFYFSIPEEVDSR